MGIVATKTLQAEEITQPVETVEEEVKTPEPKPVILPANNTIFTTKNVLIGLAVIGGILIIMNWGKVSAIISK